MIFHPENCERKIVTLHAHTHTNDNIQPGEAFEGWLTKLNEGTCDDCAPGPVPFQQFIVGAGGGSWWSGDFNSGGIPEAFQRLGAPRGYFIFDFMGSNFYEHYKVPGHDLSYSMSLDILTPEMVEWFEHNAAFRLSNPGPEDKPPMNINDLADTKIVLSAHKAESMLSANIWLGGRNSIVHAHFDDHNPIPMHRTQPGNGEGMIQTLDPVALKRQMNVARYAYTSTSNETRSEGFELFRGTHQCYQAEGSVACTPRSLSEWLWTDQSCHIWQVPIPEALENGAHVVKVVTIDQHGRQYHDSLVFEIADERPLKYFDKDFFYQNSN